MRICNSPFQKKKRRSSCSTWLWFLDQSKFREIPGVFRDMFHRKLWKILWTAKMNILNVLERTKTCRQFIINIWNGQSTFVVWSYYEKRSNEAYCDSWKEVREMKSLNSHMSIHIIVYSLRIRATSETVWEADIQVLMGTQISVFVCRPDGHGFN